MDSPAGRTRRVLIGFAVPLYLLTALSLAEGRISLLSNESPVDSSFAPVFALLAILTTLLQAYIGWLGDRPHGSSRLDSIISREEEGVMLERLSQEQQEADVSSMGSAWAEMEKEHLEKSLGEEE
ncbi:MAG: hypothetical protein VYC60_01535 [Candidatus Thermoplasmatota archaeon]|nr:hypothetical protein [Candidatus Thermoplasmatota archaeon]|tara:strand:+ start:25346 stop:25720 length:375 start_codon:yes stop_codon:yes gene_type:complete